MNKIKVFFVSFFIILFSSAYLMAGGEAKIVVNKQAVETNDEFGAYLVLGGDGSYDIYVGITGGVLGNVIYFLDSDGNLTPFMGTDYSMPKFKSNLDIGSLSTKDKIVTVYKKFEIKDASSIKGDYRIFVGLCTPGKFDFVVSDSMSFEIK